MLRRSNEDSDRGRGWVGRRSSAVAVVGAVVAGTAILGRTLQAAAAGDTDFVHFQLTAGLIGASSTALLFLSLSARFLPGQIRARRLEVLFPQDVVITGRVDSSVLKAFSGGASSFLGGVPGPSPLVTFGVTANGMGLSFWGSVRKPRLLGAISWSDIGPVSVSNRVVVGNKYPALRIECVNPETVLDFRVASGRRFGIALAKQEDLLDMAARMETFRKTINS